MNQAGERFHTLVRSIRNLLNGAVQLVLGLLSWLPITALAGAAALAWLAWWWAGQAGSLQQAARLARAVLPALHGLDVQAPQASLRQGGRIEGLRWQQNGLTLEAQQAMVAWEWPNWYQSRQSPVLLTAEVHTLRMDDHSLARQSPATPPKDLVLPWPLKAQLHIQNLQAAQWPQQQMQDVRWQHSYETGSPLGAGQHTTHAQATIASGENTARYELNATLKDTGNLALLATLQAQAQGQLGGKPWQATLNGELNGPLAGKQAQLQAALRAEWSGPSTQARTATPSKPPLELQATLQPWQPQPVHQLAAHLHELNLTTWLPGWPRTAISGQVHVQPQANSGSPTSPEWVWQAVMDLSNPAHGPWNQGQLPLERLQATAQGNPQQGQLQQLNVQLAQGKLEGTGEWSPPAQRGDSSQARTPATTPSQATAASRIVTGNLRWSGLQASALHSRLPPWVGTGSISATPTQGQTQWQGTAAWEASKLDSKQDTTIKRKAVFLFEILSQANGYLIQQAKLAVDDDWLLQAQGTATSATRVGLAASSEWLGPSWQLTGQARLSAPGLLATAEATQPGQGRAQVQATDLHRLQQAAAPWWRLLDALQPGSVAALASVTAMEGQAHLQAQWGRESEASAPVAVRGTLTVPNASGGPVTPKSAGNWHVSNLNVQFSGNTRELRSEISGQLGWNQLMGQLQAQALLQRSTSGSSQPAGALAQLRIPVLQLQLGVRQVTATTPSPAQTPAPVVLQLSLADPIQAEVQSDSWQLSPGAVEWKALYAGAPARPAPSVLSWQASSYRAGVLQSQGEWRNLNLPTLQSLQQLAEAASAASAPSSTSALQGDLTLQGQWSANWPVASAGSPVSSLQIKLARTGGDILLPGADEAQARTTIGLRDLHITLQGQANQLALEAQSTSHRLGKLHAQAQVAWPVGDLPWAASALTGRVDWSDTHLAYWSSLAPPGWRLGGLATLKANLAGTLAQPAWQGDLKVQQLSLRSVAEGLAYENGELLAQLSGQRMGIQQFRLEGAGGQARGGAVEVQGHIDWPDFNRPPSVQLEVQANGLNVSTRADRRLTLSGQAQMGVQQGTARLRGNLRADQARFRLPDETAPTQGADVVVRMTREATKPADVPPGLRTDVDVTIDLGPDFAFEGLGVDTRLKGKLRVVSPPANPQFSVTGEVQTVKGTYRAYGQRLNIAQGVLRFSGPYDDPALDILAIRTIRKAFDTSADPAQEVGVRLSGSARQPVLRLYAKPDLPDADKLAFLVLGRSASGAGAEAALLQQAAVALLAGSGPGMDATLARTLGLDEVSFQSQTSSGGTAERSTSLLLGKRLSDRLYVAYEHSLSGSVSAISLFYDLSRRLTLRARAGQTQALDLIATLPHD